MDTTGPTLTSIDEDFKASLEVMLEDPLTHPVAGATTVRELMDLLSQRGDYDRRDAALHTLITRAATDPQARTLVLHAMAPGLTAIASKTYKWGIDSGTRAEAYSAVIGCFYDALEHEPIRRKTTKVAARLLGEVRTRYSTYLTAQREHARELPIGDETLLPLLDKGTREATAHDSQLNLLEALAWARDHEVITLDEARFLLAVYSPHAGPTLDELDLSHLTPAAIRKRASRITQRLAAAVAADRDGL